MKNSHLACSSFKQLQRVAITSIVISLLACSPKQDADKAKNEIVVHGSNVIARIKTCDQGSHKGYYTALDGAIWVEDKLIVTVKEGHICGGITLTKPEYSLIKDRLHLRWNWQKSEALTACICDHDLRFEISNLPPGNYPIELESRTLAWTGK